LLHNAILSCFSYLYISWLNVAAFASQITTINIQLLTCKFANFYNNDQQGYKMHLLLCGYGFNTGPAEGLSLLQPNKWSP